MRIPPCLRRSYERRRDDERGATLIIVGICSVLFLWAGAFSVDLGLETVGNRQLQSVADAGAFDAARYINVAGASLLTQAQRAASDNGSSATMTAALGYWTGSQYEPESGYCSTTTPSSYPPCNAVDVTASQSVPELFHGGSSALTRSAVAAVTPLSSFSIGSYLASYNSQQTAMLNDVLAGLGGSVSLTAAGYAGLANTDVTMLQLISASGGLLTPANVLTTSLSSAEWLTILENASGSTSLSSSMGSSNASSDVSLCQLVSVNGSTCSNGTLAPSALSAGINVLQTLATEAELANGTNAITVTNAVDISGVTGTLTTDLVQIPQVATGPVNTTASTSQVDATLTLAITGVGTLVIPVSAADGSATLHTITCVDNAMTSTKINAGTTAGTGNVTLQGTSIATLTVSGVSTTGLSYSALVVPPTSSTMSADTNPITIGSTSPDVSFGTVNYGGIITPTQQLVVTPILATVSDSLASLLQPLGVAAAGAEVADLGSACGAVSLVQ
jgi:uncharacterized membrane protein